MKIMNDLTLLCFDLKDQTLRELTSSCLVKLRILTLISKFISPPTPPSGHKVNISSTKKNPICYIQNERGQVTDSQKSPEDNLEEAKAQV